MKDTTVCFTGHREISADKRKDVLKALAKTVGELYLQGYRTFCAGGALGFDTLAAAVVLVLKKKKDDVRLHLILPCPDQTKGWRQADIDMYEAIKAEADDITYIAPRYARGCMHARNRRLVEESTVCVAYMQKENGGTAYTVSYAKQHKLQIINIAQMV
jgi:uncharacterized phage-like protein YoqJ